MKVKVIYDFSVEEIEDFKNDIVKIEMRFRDYQGIKNAIIEAMTNPNLESNNYYKGLLKRLNEYETESKF